MNRELESRFNDDAVYFSDSDESNDVSFKPILTNKEYSDEFYAGFHDGKKSQGITDYVRPVERSHRAYQMTKMNAYRQGFNLALISVMMKNHDDVDRNKEWFRWYCDRLQNKV